MKISVDKLIEASQAEHLKAKQDKLKKLNKNSEVSEKKIEKLERKAAFQLTKQNIHQWQEQVNLEKKAEQIDLTKGHIDLTLDKMLQNDPKPQNKFEEQVQSIIEQEKQNEDKFELTPQEIKERYEKLAKLRASAFYQEQINKHKSKIKSKKFRKHQRKLMKTDEQDFERIQERMSLRHRKGDQLSKKILKKAQKNPETLKNLSKNENLRKKMLYVEGQSETEESEEDAQENDNLEEDLGSKRLRSLKFMQKGNKKDKKEEKKVDQEEAELSLRPRKKFKRQKEKQENQQQPLEIEDQAEIKELPELKSIVNDKQKDIVLKAFATDDQNNAIQEEWEQEVDIAKQIEEEKLNKKKGWGR